MVSPLLYKHLLQPCFAREHSDLDQLEQKMRSQKQKKQNLTQNGTVFLFFSFESINPPNV
jgi:hypothetical protein